MPKTNNTYYAILGMLNSKGPLSGYDINKIFEKTSNWYWTESNAQLYPMLKKLEEKRLVTSSLCQSGQARQRRCYKITPTGIKNLKDWLKEPVEERPKREELLLKLRFSSLSDTPTVLKHLKQFKHNVIGKLLKLDTIIDEIDQVFEGKPDREYLTLTTEYAKDILSAKIKWAQKSIAALEKKQT